MRGRAALLAAGCALASLDARADPYAQAFANWFLAVGAGCLACIGVELAAGRTRWFARLAIGAGFAILDLFLYLTSLSIMIQVDAPYLVLMLASWILPALRLGWLLRKRSRP